jgi:hypothetical protein
MDKVQYLIRESALYCPTHYISIPRVFSFPEFWTATKHTRQEFPKGL